MPKVPRHLEDDEELDRTDESSDEQEEDEPSRAEEERPRKKRRPRPAPPPKRRRWGRFLVILLGLAGLFAAAPMIVAGTPLRDHLLAVCVPKFPGQARIGRATLAWWSPLQFDDVAVLDGAGDELLAAERLTSGKPLWQIALGPFEPGTFRIERPVATIVVHETTTNLEEALAPLLRSPSKSRGFGPFAYRVEVVNGRIDLRTADAARASIERLELTLDSSRDPHVGLSGKLAASVTPRGNADPGSLSAEFTYREPPPARSDAPAAEVVSSADPPFTGALTIEGVRLDDLEPVWARLEPSLRLAGLLDARLKLRGLPEPGGETLAFGVGGTASVRAAQIESPRFLKDDRLQLDQVSFAGGVEIGARTVRADRLRIETAPAWLEADGTFPLAALSDPASWRDLWKTVSSENYALNGELDGAKLARLIPGVLRIRSDVEIDSGLVKLSLSSFEEQGDRQIAATIETSDVAVRSAAGPFTWREPVRCELASRITTDGPVVDRLVCRSSFLEAAGRGTLKEARFLARCDLDRLTQDLGRIVDLSEFQLSGRMTADGECRTEEDDRVIVSGRVGLSGFVWAVPGGEPLREPQLDIDLSADGRSRELRLERLNAASVSIKGEADELTVELLRPVMLGEVQDQAADVPLRVQLNGPLALWQMRMRPWWSSPWRLDGGCDLSTHVTFAGDRIHVQQLQGTVRELTVRGPGGGFREAWVQLTGEAHVNLSERKLASDELVATGSAFSLRAADLTVTLPTEGLPQFKGIIAFRGDLDRLSRSAAVAGGSASTYRGTIAGRVQAVQNADVTQAEWDVKGTGLSIVYAPPPDSAAAADPRFAAAPAFGGPRSAPAIRPASNVWTIGDATFTGRAEYDLRRDALHVAACELSSDPAALTLAGRLTDLSTRPQADVSGTLAWDWDRWLPYLRESLGSGVRLTGRQNESFAFRGPLTAGSETAPPAVANVSLSPGTRGALRSPAGSPPRDLWSEAAGRATVGWETADFYGFSGNALRMSLTLREGLVRADPIDWGVSDGRLTANPLLAMSPGPPELRHDKGRILENVRFTPEMCQKWLKYVAPLLADATQIDGRFSLDLTAARVPLSSPKAGDVHGVLIVPRADVRPGPVADELIQVGRQAEVLLGKRDPSRVARSADALLALQNQNVEFRLLEGRIHHRGLEVLVGDDVTIRTRGSVGLDDTLDLVAEIPIREEWARRDKLFASLAGQTLEVPIRGTLSRPQVDPRVLQDLARKAATGSVTNTIENELGKQLDKLFKRRP